MYCTTLRNLVLLALLIRTNSITKTIKTMISYLCKYWLLYNCTKVIDTSGPSPDINPIENFWVHLKKIGNKYHQHMTSRSLFNP